MARKPSFHNGGLRDIRPTTSTKDGPKDNISRGSTEPEQR